MLGEAVYTPVESSIPYGANQFAPIASMVIRTKTKKLQNPNGLFQSAFEILTIHGRSLSLRVAIVPPSIVI